jgi:Flp pilus assembly protein TadG
MPSKSKSRSGQSGASLVETAVTVAFVVPLCFYALFVAMEASQTFGISQALQQGAREAARRIATTYAVDPGIVNNVGDQTKYGYDPVRINGVIADSSQFTATFNPDNANPTSVSVTATYASGKFGLPPFPQNADPLFLGPNFKLQSSATYTLE